MDRLFSKMSQSCQLFFLQKLNFCIWIWVHRREKCKELKRICILEDFQLTSLRLPLPPGPNHGSSRAAISPLWSGPNLALGTDWQFNLGFWPTKNVFLYQRRKAFLETNLTNEPTKPSSASLIVCKLDGCQVTVSYNTSATSSWSMSGSNGTRTTWRKSVASRWSSNGHQVTRKSLPAPVSTDLRHPESRHPEYRTPNDRSCWRPGPEPRNLMFVNPTKIRSMALKSNIHSTKI